MPDLTRETIAELRRLDAKATEALKAFYNCPAAESNDWWSRHVRAATARDVLVLQHFDSLLLAAERGLDAGDGR